METYALMNEAAGYLPGHVIPWLMWMMFILFLLPFFFVWYRAARYMIGANILNTLTSWAVFYFSGLQVNKLWALGHLFWILPMYLFYKDARNSERWIVYRVFAGLAAATIAASLVMDFRDFGLWALGERGSILVGVPEDKPYY